MENGCIYVHKGCLDWSPPAKVSPSNAEDDKNVKIEENLTNDTDEGVKAIVAIALQRKCSFCLRFGASISCKVRLYSLYRYF